MGYVWCYVGVMCYVWCYRVCVVLWGMCGVMAYIWCYGVGLVLSCVGVVATQNWLI